MTSPIPIFVMGDTAKALRVTLRDANGAVIDPADGVSRLYAIGLATGDRPGADAGDGVNSVLGVYGAGILDSDGNKAVEFQALGNLCDIGTGRSAERYQYRIQFTHTSDSSKSRSSPSNEFIVEEWS